MKIRYLTPSNDVLGEVSHSQFDQVLIPFYSSDGADTFLFRQFSDNQHTSWKVEYVGLNDQSIDISLSIAQGSRSIGVIADESNTKTNGLIKKNCIVEVDFGHKVSAVDSSGGISKNTKCPSTHLPSEMYKRRPCVVLAVDGERIQVLPLTTAEVHRDPESFQISASSFKGLHQKYTSSACKTLPRMIQTVSSYRVFPPLLASGKFPTTCFRYKLCSEDCQTLKETIAAHFNASLVKDYNILKNAHEQLQKEKKSLFLTNEELKNSKASLEEENSQLVEIIERIGSEFDISGTPEEIMKAIV